MTIMADNEASNDTELQLKKRARRRLVGASALVLLAVIVLPMVMDHEPRPPVQDIQVRIPSQDAPSLAAKMLQGKEAATALPAPKPEAKPETKPEPAPAPAPAAAAPAPVTTPAPAAKPEPKAEAKPEPKPEVKPEVKPEPKPAAKPAETKAPETKPAAPAKPATAAAPAPAPAVAIKAAAEGSGQWEIQLGAYKEGGNAKLLLKKLKEINLPAYSEKFDSPQGPRIRVRAGPFATREAAEKAHARLKIIGVDGPVAQK